MTDESYELDSGLAFTSEITDAFFETNDEWPQPEVPRLILETAADRQIRLKVGKDWEMDDKGTCVTHPTKASFNKNSAIGRFLTSVIKLDGGREILENRGHATEAKIWKGLVLGFDSIPDTFKNDDGEEIEYQVQIVTAINDSGKGGAAKVDDLAPLQEQLDALWADVKPDHAKFMEQAYVQVPEVATKPELIAQIEDASNWV